MHFYQHEISRWALETQGLSLAHVGAYMRLVDRYLSTEKPIKTQWVSLAFGSDDARIANEVLAAFFEPAENPEEGWIHPEFAKEIAAYQARAVTNKANGKRGGRPRKAKETESVSAGFSDESEGEAKKSLTQELNNSRTQRIESTNVLSTQAQAPASTPVRRRKTSGVSSVEKPDEIPAQVWSDWLQIRKAKRLPLTKTAWDAMLVEAEKVGYSAEEMVRCCVERGWASFKAQWVINEEEEQKNKRSSSKTNGLQEQFNNNPAYMEANGDWAFTE